MQYPVMGRANNHINIYRSARKTTKNVALTICHHNY